MCGRYSLNLENSKSNFKEETLVKFSKIFTYKNSDISPSTNNPVIFFRNNEYIFDLFKWGLNFDWLPKGRVLFNLRSETVLDKGFSKNLILKQRCLVPFNSYYEWQNNGSSKQKFELKTNYHISYFAAIYSKLGSEGEYSILTKASSPNVQHIHERNPLIINNNLIRKWFSDDFKDILNTSIELDFSKI